MYCTLCNSHANRELNIRNRTYFLCPTCDLLFMDVKDRLSKELELERYLKHRNLETDKKYRSFLFQVAEPCFEYISTSSLCLDYGSGSSLVMELIFKEHGFNMQSYDPYFAPINLLHGSYDLIVCNEVCEHFYNPAHEFKRIKSLLKPEGVFVAGTNLRDQSTDLNKWHYLSDATHVSMYSIKSFEHIAAKLGFKVLKVLSDRVVILKSFTL